MAFHAPQYLHSSDRYPTSLHGFLRGRVALGLGRPEEAADHFREGRDAFLEMDRDYDAILTSLCLADALLAAGRTSELRSLATDLVPLFRSRGVARETVAALRLVARAAAAESLSTQVLRDVRHKVAKAATASGK